MADATIYERKLWHESEIEALDAIKKAGVHVTYPDKELFSVITGNHRELLLLLETYVSSRINSDEETANIALIDYKEIIAEIATNVDQKLLEREIWYNKTNLLYFSLAFYILSFLFVFTNIRKLPPYTSFNSTSNISRSCSSKRRFKDFNDQYSKCS